MLCGSLMFVCVSDSGVLLVGLANQYVRYVFGLDVRAQSDFLCRAHVAATHLLIDYSIWALCLISAQRALVIVAPRLFERLFSRSSIAVLLTALAYVLLGKNILLCMHFRTCVFYTPSIGLRRTCLAVKSEDHLLQVRRARSFRGAFIAAKSAILSSPSPPLLPPLFPADVHEFGLYFRGESTLHFYCSVNSCKFIKQMGFQYQLFYDINNSNPIYD